MPEMKNNFQGGKMNKDLDERLVPSGEYRDALNVEIATTDSSDLGTLRTLKGNLLLGGTWQGTAGVPESGTCVGSISDDKNDKLYFMIAGEDTDFIIEYDYSTQLFFPVCVDNHTANAHRALNFNKDFLITGVNIIEDLLFWTDNNSEPKRINITRGKAFGATLSAANYYTTHTNLMVKDVSAGAAPNTFVNSGKLIEEEHLTVIRKGPPAAPVLEMLDTLSTDDWDGDDDLGGAELRREVSSLGGSWLDSSSGEFVDSIVISVSPDPDGDTGYQAGTDFSAGDILNVYQSDDRTIKVRVKVISGGSIGYTCEILSGNKDIESALLNLTVELEQRDALFQFKFPRFACRYKYEDGEYSAFSPFTEPAFLPGPFNYVPKEGYNLGMLNNLRKLAIKDFVHDRQIPDDVVAIDILYKESNSTNIYSVKTIKKREYNASVWNEWNALSSDSSWNPALNNFNNTKARVTGYMPITTEMIHAVLPANQLLRPWDNVPRKALAQEVIGNRLVYGNYLQNYNLENLDLFPAQSSIKVDLQAGVLSTGVGAVSPEEIHAGLKRHLDYYPAKSLKSLRTYQIGVVYLDQYGRETPVFSEDKRGANYDGETSAASVYVEKDRAPKRNALLVTMKNDPPSWATHMKFFVKETSNEYYNLSMDRWYDAEDGNIWLSFPSADRNKVDEETFIILKKEHDNNNFIEDPARYKIIAIENEAPRFIKLQNISMGGVQDGFLDADGMGSDHWQIAPNAVGFPGEPGAGLSPFQVNIHKHAFELAGWKESLINKDVSQTYFRMLAPGIGTSLWYRIKQVTWDAGDGTYAIKSGKQFGGDMAWTSPDGTYFNRINSCELSIMKKIPEDRAEFEGRFFVKILKDHTLIEKLGITSTVADNTVVTNSLKVQYIAPKEQQVDNGGWDGFGTNPMRISMDPDMTYFTPSDYSDNGQGEKFWKMAGDDEADGSLSASSGWFIDKVEAFRPMKGQVHQFVSTKDNKVKWTSSNSPRNATLGSGKYHSYWNNPADDLLQATGLDTYKQADLDYLGLNMRTPGRDSDVLRSNSGHRVSRSLGIDPSIGLIHLSYAGLNTGDGGGNYTGANDYTNADWDFKEGSKHNGDIAFINKIRQAGTMWGWAEDPGKVKYKTIVSLPVNTNSDYTSDWMAREKMDRDGGFGVFLYNYASFNDYFIKDHHKAWYDGSLGSCDKWKEDFASRSISNHEFYNYALCLWWDAKVSLKHHGDDAATEIYPTGALGTSAPAGWSWNAHHKFPTGIQAWKTCYNRRRRFAIFAEVLDGGGALGSVAPHYYLPTNNPNDPPHFDHQTNPITTFPAGHAMEGDTITTPAPGIRPDGMYWGYDGHPGGPFMFDRGDGDGAVSVDQIGQYKRWDANYTTNGAPPRESGVPGSVTFQIFEHFEADSEKFTSTNPAIWETEPKEDVGLDIYYEVGQIYPIELNNKTIEQFVGPVHIDITKNSYVHCWDPPYAPGSGAGTISLTAGGSRDVRVLAAKDNYVRLGVDQGSTWTAPELALDSNNALHTTPVVGSYLMFHRADGSRTEAHVGPNTYNVVGEGTWYELVGISGETGVHNKQIVLPWFNCYSFGNGVESDRIRDDFNQVTIDNGPKASTTLEEPYLEERRSNGFIWSGLYNSTSGVNDLNQFIQAEAITKDTNPSYGSIQKLYARDSDLVAFCEDRVLKVPANKDLLYNADGNTNVVATNKVLGTIRPFIGDYGISLNPESFASDSHRAYFADSSRGAVLRLSQDGITAISSVGMHAFFAGTLARTGDYNIIGSFDDNKSEYNMTLESMTYEPSYLLPLGTTQTSPCSTGVAVLSGTGTTTAAQGADVVNTLSYSEKSKGWVSFKSWDHENGISLNNSYYTFKNGNMYKHHANETHNNFYGNQFESSVDVLFNKAPGIIKSYSTFNYEGSQARITPGINNNPDYYDNLPKTGWYIGSVASNAQELGELEFWDKEDKWFSQIKGVTTEWLNDGTAGNIDPREFSFQGIGDSISVSCPTCPTVTSWNCVGSPCDCVEITGSSGTYPTELACNTDTNACCGFNETWCCTDNGCIDPGDGSGGFATLCDCVANCCEDGYTYLYDCMGVQPVPVAPYIYGCMDDGITTDLFITQDRPFGWVGSATTYSSQANVPNCDCEYTSTTPSYDCFHGNCVGAIGGSGQYATWQDCIDNCVYVPPSGPSYDCFHGNCVGAVSGTGAYATYQDCLDNCGNITTSPSYDCFHGNCVGAIGGTGMYATYQDCDDNCGVVVQNASSYSCSTYSGMYTGFPQQYQQPYTCFEVLSNFNNQPVPFGTPGAGIYPTMLDCLDDTTNSCSGSYDCVSGNCVGLTNNSGQYPTFDDCDDNCGGPCYPNCDLSLAIPYGLGVGTYAPGAIVEYNGSFYLMSSSGLNGTPGDPSNGWELCCSFTGTYPGNDAYECDFPLGTNLSAYAATISGIGFGDEFCCNWEAVVFQQVNPSCPGAYDGVLEVFLPIPNNSAFSILQGLAFQQGTIQPATFITWRNANGDLIGNGASTVNTSSSDTLTGMPAGTYTAQVWNCDSNDAGAFTPTSNGYYGCSQPGCSHTVTVTLVDPSPMSVVGTVTDATPATGGGGNSDGSISLNVTGGVAPYIYAWSNGTSAQTASGLSLGPYSVSVTDAGGCIVSGSWFVLLN